MNDFYNILPPDAIDPTTMRQERSSQIPDNSNGILVTFFEYNEYQSHASEIEGRPVYKKTTYIRKIADAKSDFQRRVRDSDKIKYAKQWAAYEANQDSHGIIGTMLDTYAKSTKNLSNAELQLLRDNKVFTVEQLAEMGDTQLQTIGGGARGYKKDAALWLEGLKAGTVERQLMQKVDELEKKYEATVANSKSSEELEAKEKEIEEMKEQNKALQEMNAEVLAQYKELNKKVEALEAKPKRKR